MTYYKYWYTKYKTIWDDESSSVKYQKEVRHCGYTETFDKLEQKVKPFVQEIQTATKMEGVDSIDVHSWGDNGFCASIRKGDITYVYYLSVNR